MQYLRNPFRLGASSSGAPDANTSTMEKPRIQVLYELCRDIFVPHHSQALGNEAKASTTGTLPCTAAQVEELSRLMRTLEPTDVGLAEPLEDDSRSGNIARGFGLGKLFDKKVEGESTRPDGQPEKWSRPIKYLHIHEEDRFSMGIFCMPTCAPIPLHDHPGMLVMGKLLYGQLRVRSYSLKPEDAANAGRNAGKLLEATLVKDEVLDSSAEPALVLPDVGNLHELTPITPCAMLDVLAPPYAVDDGRDCTYYEEVESGAKHYLQEWEPPAIFRVTRGSYHGPSVRRW